MDKDLIFKILQRALVMFFKKEQRNLELDVYEICHAHRLAIYIEQQIRMYDIIHCTALFKDYSVDIEFNRTKGRNPKILHTDDEKRKIRCDILLHSKGQTTPENLLAIELKKGNSKNRECKDKKELKHMVKPRQDGDPDNAIRGTILGVFLRIYEDRYSGTKYWYENGDVRNEEFDKSQSEFCFSCHEIGREITVL